ncbi:MAG: TIGR00159 family protein [Chloroflexi bacterium]|nr:TIGR00159 family protein [Ardenticatenaceae bacterium]MBL1129375.1 TIGR00159 family protein [Chloroflexota bacterium]NOG35454.1 TIGR00159 family protein [Chloroflexota bacterium]GIK55301.1 MAG: TIGR00159 family protein [Chloroflexota bacterium]
MNEITVDSILETVRNLRWGWISVLDILLVTAVIFAVFLLIRGTRAVQVLRGLVVIALAVLVLASIPGLIAFRSLVNTILPVLLISIPIIFQPELRRALERIGRSGRYLRFWRQNEINPMITAVKEACLRLSQRRHGALITFERDTGLQEYIDSGIAMNADISAELLLTIFNKHTELHDGAVIIRGEKLAAAACVMPLSTSSLSDRQMGLRHRAALGISEVSDAVTVVVSEETGQVSITHNGRFIVRRLEPSRLDEVLHTMLTGSTSLKNNPIKPDSPSKDGPKGGVL